MESVKWYLGAHRGPWWKRKYPHLITREKLSDVRPSHRVPPFPSWNSLLTLLSWILQRYIWELTEGYVEKGNIHISKLERSLLRNCTAMCECNSQSHTFVFSDQFASKVFRKSAMRCSEVKTTKKWRSEPMKITVTKELSSEENEKEVFFETSRWFVNSSHRVTLMFHGALH